MNALYQMMLKEAQGTLHVNVAPRMLPRVQRNPASPPAAQPTQRAATPQAAQVAQAPQRAATPPAAQASRPPAAPPVIPKGTHQKNPQAPQPPPAPAKARADRYTMGPAKSDAYTLGPAPAQAAPAQAQATPAQAAPAQAAPAQAAPAQAAPAQATPAAEAPARHPLSYVDGAMTHVRQARANAHTHFTPENLQTLRDTRATVGKWGRRAGTIGALGAGLAVGKRVLDDGTGSEQDARMRDFLSSTQHQMTGALPGMQVYGSYEAFGAAKHAEIDAMVKTAEPPYSPYPYANSAHAAMSAEFGKALAQKLVSEPIDLAHRFLKKKLIDVSNKLFSSHREDKSLYLPGMI